MNHFGQRVNIALEIQTSIKVDQSTYQFSGRVLAPQNMVGEIVKINLTDRLLFEVHRIRKSEDKPENLQDKARRILKEANSVYSSIDDLEHKLFEKIEKVSRVGDIVVFLQSSASDGHWGAWEAYRLGDTQEFSVEHAYCRVNVKTHPNGMRVSTDLLFPHKSAVITTKAEFKAFFDQYFQSSIDDVENNSNCLFRLRSETDGFVKPFWLYAARENVEVQGSDGRTRRFNIPASLEQTWDEAIVRGVQAAGFGSIVAKALGVDVQLREPSDEAYAQALSEAIARKDIVVEAIPGQRVRMIGGVLTQLENSKSRLRETIEECVVIGEDNVPKSGFYPMFAVTRRTLPQSAGRIQQQSYTSIISQLIYDEEGKAVLPIDIPMRWNP